MTKALGIRERQVRKLFRGKVKFEVKSRTAEELLIVETGCRSDIGEEPEYEIMDFIDAIIKEEQTEKEKERSDNVQKVTPKQT